MTLLESLPRVMLALFVGGLVGFERERRDLPAGIRTHMLLCGGSALIMLVSIGMAGTRADTTRIAAQIVSGIGFLGAGTIFRSGANVRGLTTAAGLWLVAGVGMGIAAGGTLLPLAVITALVVFVVNTWVRGVEDRWIRPHHDLLLTLSRGEDGLPHILAGLADWGILVHQVQWVSESSGPNQAVVRMTLHLPSGMERRALSDWLVPQPGVLQSVWE